jgi:hypothetical protein
MARQKTKETEAAADVVVETGGDNQNASHTFDQVEELRAAVSRLTEEADQMHAAALACMNVPLSSQGRVQDVKNVLDILCDECRNLEARVAEFESNAAVERRDVGSTSSGDDKDMAVEAYNLYVKGQADGEYHAWSELDTPTQKLWRDGYNHVAGGGKPRTDYEQAVRYLILSAQ